MDLKIQNMSLFISSIRNKDLKNVRKIQKFNSVFVLITSYTKSINELKWNAFEVSCF